MTTRGTDEQHPQRAPRRRRLRGFGVALLLLVAAGLVLGVVRWRARSRPRPAATVVANNETTATATFAGGCFWCMEPPFESLPGVHEVISGYTGGTILGPTYEEVTSGQSGHVEAVQVRYDPRIIAYEYLLRVFFKSIDPTDDGGQFADRGSPYRTAVFYHTEAQRELAARFKAALARSGRFDRPIATQVRRAGPFYPAEEQHQDFHRKSPERYLEYRLLSGRDEFLNGVWGPVRADGQRRESAGIVVGERRLTPLQYWVTQKQGTEPPFANAFWNNADEGLYVDVVSGEPLFSSTDKFDSGTGWPSFTRPLDPEAVVTREDPSHGQTRTEVRSRKGNSHLGHLFADGPAPTGKRYCVNSAALRFIPRAELAARGYGSYLRLFQPRD